MPYYIVKKPVTLGNGQTYQPDPDKLVDASVFAGFDSVLFAQGAIGLPGESGARGNSAPGGAPPAAGPAPSSPAPKASKPEVSR